MMAGICASLAARPEESVQPRGNASTMLVAGLPGNF